MLLSALAFTVAFWLLSGGQRKEIPQFDARQLEQQYPLVWKHIHSFDGVGGAWYIPPSWLADDQTPPTDIVEAASLASTAALFARERQVAFSNVPLLMHQTGASSKVNTWKPDVVPWVERWLEYSASPNNSEPMAYFFWDDEGIAMLMDKYDKGFVEDFNAIFTPVERADIFRIVTCLYFGGIYADIDTEPLRHPAHWNPEEEAASPSANGKQPVNLIWGLEADTDPNTNTYWRMGYTYPIQLTQWALASAPGHPALKQFMDNLYAEVLLEKNATTNDPNRADPLTRTGPAAVTLATLLWLEHDNGFRWNALTGLKDGGKTKLVADALILPITGFSPGRGSYGNMGSKPITDPDARLVHHALGSWRKFDLLVEYGKFCRTVFGLCKDWTKVPAPQRGL
ncbi:glycosyltransferase sugar-binding region containing DXD motif domain-containing protein [Trichoderma breve]|uniref:Glycosyltransferase sugar-binding region containing DXD motif domain-containing protein n=1 Tax=Trichoderma breve TaxID=2034170 RepID=A0A9W9E1G7_9HYPO|nr:glycosyltransferase sugar-binding region containing DXD motif domain-containing protein [Trichoderma breve]KAJ4854358.1 glycosyltransferase sugar-binding region containing DXD motif domain-containing protein [Trichoderma breve]